MKSIPISAPNLQFDWLVHGFGRRDSGYPADMITARQIHSAGVLDASRTKQPCEGDAITSMDVGLIVGVRTADCVPILLADKVTHAVACVHAGWRGTAENIVCETVKAMNIRYGSLPGDLVAAIGPSIGPCCYTVGPDVARRFTAWMPALETATEPIPLDLPAINRLQLLASDVEGIWTSGACTYCRAEEFFSFRREKEQAGRMLSFIGRLV